MLRHANVCGTEQTQRRKGRTAEQNIARAERVREARATAPLVNLRDGEVRGITLTSPLLEHVCLGLAGVCLDEAVEPAAWLLIRCADVAEPTRVLAAEPAETHAALQHIKYLPRGACVAVAQVQVCSRVATGFTIKFEQVVVLRSPLAYAYAHACTGWLWSVEPAVLPKLKAQTKSTTFVCSDAQNAETTVGVALHIGRIWKQYS
mmetsp:Transcript_41326/g.101990  ORF Transcript_41326/g.101990 Transcript_41326/m.101990 type:complete len:205 (+) Transcript_41326:124-738(+)